VLPKKKFGVAFLKSVSIYMYFVTCVMLFVMYINMLYFSITVTAVPIWKFEAFVEYQIWP